MNRFKITLVCVALFAVLFAVVRRDQFRVQLIAQDSPGKPIPEPRTQSNAKASAQTDAPGEPAYPILFVDDLIDVLKKNTERLISEKATHNTENLRKHIDRKNYSMGLAAAAAKELTTQDLYRRLSDSVFLVAGMTRPDDDDKSWQTAFSTAFVIHEDGILSTSSHVFEHEDVDDAVVVMDRFGQVFPVVEILAADLKADTCVFRVGKKGLKPLPLGKENPLPGTPIRVMGHPGDSFFYFTAGHIANYEQDDEGLLWMNVTADFGQGSSGGPVVDSAGNVVGQVSRTYTLYATGETSQRKQRPRSSRRQAVETDANAAKTDDDESSGKKKSDPQMVFKACTPISALRSLLK